ncbi:MAG: HlyD family efflux transporter periplasmic adaptor subunit, partial [Gammaproteobacteria bacterium]|nr:HlyD family efflux transporter periplasmic adaptor subunit [Gammaproteobacteria bacterium]
FSDKQQPPTGGLIFFRDVSFTDSERKMLRWLLNSYQYTWSTFIRPKRTNKFKILQKKPYLIAALIAFFCIIFFPVRLSVLGSGTVAAKNPALINAPMQGVIKAFAVSPGDVVKKGQLLVLLDDSDLLAAEKVNQKDFNLTEVKLRTTINEAFSDESKRLEIPILQAQLAIDKAQLDYTNDLLEKTKIKSPIDGVVIFDSTEDWIGQPVQTGERILSVANTKNLKLKISLPISERISLEVGDSGSFFVSGHLNAISVQLTRLGYNAKLTPNKVLAYEMDADFDDSDDLPQIGVQGTVKLYGNRVPLIYYLIRRPIQALRSNLGI